MLPLALVDGFFGQVEAVEQVALAKEGRFRRVDVLARHERLDTGKQATAQAHRPALDVADGEQAAAAKEVVERATRGRAAQHADGFQDLGSVGATARLLEDPVALGRGEAKLEAFDALGREAPLLKVLAGRLGFGGV